MLTTTVQPTPALRRPPARRARMALPRMGADPVRVAGIVFLFFLQFGLVSLFAVGNTVPGQQAASLLILAGLAVIPLVRRRNFRLGSIADAFPIVLLGVMLLVSFVSNQMIFQYGWGNWLTYSYVAFPILAYYLFWAFSISVADVLAAVIVMAVIACGIVLADTIVHIAALDPIQRYTNVDTGVRRVPILKNEVVLAFCLLFADMYTRSNWWRYAAFYLPAVALIFFTVAFRFESRIALAAMLAAAGIFVASRRITSPVQLFYLLAGLLLGIPLLYLALQSYIQPILDQGFSTYAANHNVEVRFRSNAYFASYYYRTNGLGFGLMTLNQQIHNFQSYGIPSSFVIADLGLMGALYQFGVLGVVLAFGATLSTIVTFMRIGRGGFHPHRDRLLVVGCYMIGFTLQPIPMNFFTLNWTTLLGATLWYLMRRAAWEDRALKINRLLADSRRG